MNDETIILEGKNLDSLIEEGMKKLDKSKEQLNVEILESKKGLFSSHFKVKISLKHDKTIENIERRLEDIYNSPLMSEITQAPKDVEFIYKEDGVFIKLSKVIPIHELKLKIDLKKISGVNYDALAQSLKNAIPDAMIKIADKQIEEIIDSKCNITFSTNQLEAFLYVMPPSNNGKSIDEETIRNALKANNVVFGILDEEIKKVVENKLYDMEIKIAEGIMPINGADAKLEYHFETDAETKLLESESGKVDFRELSLIKNITAGEVLVSIIPAVEGIPGKSVTGEDIKPKEGKHLQLPKGKNVSISEDGLQLISNINGEVKLIDGKVNVFSLFTVPANVDNSTGNIRFIGKVIVKGNVLTGFSIEAEGDVEVFGVVEGAKIISKGNIVLHRGIQGMNKGELYCDGDLVAKFIENSIIEVKGNIHSDAIMHSHIVCGKKLEASGRKGLLVGGSFKVSDEIKAKVIGSPMATITELEVGINPDMRRRYETLKVEYKSIIENLEKMNQAVDLLTKISQKSELSFEKREILAKSIQAKLQLSQKLEENNKEIKELEVYLEELSKGKIKVTDVIYPGTRVTMGSSMMHVKDPLQYLTLYRSGADIKIGPYEN